MKFILATLLLASTVGAFKSLVDLSVARSNRLHHLLKDGPINVKKLTETHSLTKTTAHLARLLKKGEPMNDQHEGEEEEEEESGSAALVHVIKRIRQALTTLKEARDKQDKADAKAFLTVLKHGNATEIKELMGKHAMEWHSRCHNVKKLFANYIHKTELIALLGNDNYDFEEGMGKVLREAELNEQADVFEAFVGMAHAHGLADHVGVKAVMEIGGILADTYCDTKMDGLISLIVRSVDESDPRGSFDVSKKIKPYRYAVNSGHCMNRSLVKRAGPYEPKSLKEKALDLVFEHHDENNCDEVNLIRLIVHLIHEGEKLRESSKELHDVTQKFEAGMIAKVTQLMNEGDEDEAYKTVGQFVLDHTRGAIVIGIAVEKHLKALASAQAPP